MISSSSKPYGLTVYSSWLYWTSWNKQTIQRTSLSPPHNTTIVQSGLDYVMDLLVYHESPQEGGSSLCRSPNSTQCEGLCLLTSGASDEKKSSCGCPSHYTIMEDGVSCQGPQSFLLFSQKNKISRLLLDPKLPDEVPDIVLPIKRARSIQAVDYDPTERMIYWVDHGRGEERPGRQIIRRARDTGDSDRLGLFEKTDRFLPFDLVINPFTRTLYWTCANTNTVNVTRLGGGDDLASIGPLMVGGEEDRPRLLALHAEKELLFVTMSGGVALQVGGDVGGARLEVVHLLTNNRQVIVNTSLGEITAVTVDNQANRWIPIFNFTIFYNLLHFVTPYRVYWTDVILRRMEASNLDGSDRRVIISEGIVEPVGLAVQGQWIYWADRDQGSIVRVDKVTGTSRQTVLNKLSRLSSIVAVNHLNQDTLSSHPCYSHPCTHFCSSSPPSATPTCSCPPGLSLDTDLVTCVSPPTCKPDEFTCVGPGPSGTGKRCIPLQWRCDGQTECDDRCVGTNGYLHRSSHRKSCKLHLFF